MAVALLACRPAPGAGSRLELAVPAVDGDADVFIDGHYVGRVDQLEAGATRGFELAPGVHRVEVRKPGRYPVQRTVRVERSGPSVIVVDVDLLEEPP